MKVPCSLSISSSFLSFRWFSFLLLSLPFFISPSIPAHHCTHDCDHHCLYHCTDPCTHYCLHHCTHHCTVVITVLITVLITVFITVVSAFERDPSMLVEDSRGDVEDGLVEKSGIWIGAGFACITALLTEWLRC
jgi:hypothetical protein